MRHRRLIAATAALAVAAAATSVAVAAGSTAPAKVTIKAVSPTPKFQINRYTQNTLRWNKDVYTIRSGGTLHIVNEAAQEGPHTFTVVKEKDLPRTLKALDKCSQPAPGSICLKLALAHGAQPGTEAPPKFQYLENGVGQNTAPNVDRPGDSGLTGQGKKGEHIDLKVTAKRGTELYFMCIIHPQMQAKVLVK